MIGVHDAVRDSPVPCDNFRADGSYEEVHVGVVMAGVAVTGEKPVKVLYRFSVGLQDLIGAQPYDAVWSLPS